LLTEREYSSTHFTQKYISEEIEKLIKDFIEKIWIERAEDWISFAQTKNPWWVYVDSLWWIRDGIYEN
jgi:hypothetical protein